MLRIGLKFIIWVLLLSLTFSSCGGNYITIYPMFADVSECKDIGENEQENMIVTEISTSEDSNLQDLEYFNFYAAECISQDVSFKIFAYEFVDNAAANIYYERFANRECMNNSDFYAWSGMFTAQLVLVHDNKAYTVYTSSMKKLSLAIDILCESFSLSLDF